MRQAYARLVMDEITVTDAEIRISGSKAVLLPDGIANFCDDFAAVFEPRRTWSKRQMQLLKALGALIDG